jgi:HEAT repeat protein
MRRITLLTVGCLIFSAGLASADPPRKEDMPKFITNLKADQAKVRIAACENIAELGEIKAAYAREAVDPLLEVVKTDEDAKVREAAALALGRIDPDPVKTVPVLMAVIKEDKERFVQAAAIGSLGPLGKEAKDALPMLKELATEVRKEVTEYRKELLAAQKEKDDAKIRELQIKFRPAQQLDQALNNTMRMIQGMY